MILYALVSKQKTVLAEHTSTSGEFLELQENQMTFPDMPEICSVRSFVLHENSGAAIYDRAIEIVPLIHISHNFIAVIVRGLVELFCFLAE